MTNNPPEFLRPLPRPSHYPSATAAVGILAVLLITFLPGETFCADNYKLMAKKFSSAAKAHKITRVAIIPFLSPNPGFSQEGRAVSERLISRLAQLGEVEVVERNLLEKVMREHWLTAAGAVTQPLTNKSGRLVPADAIITGYVSNNAGICEINARMIETETGIILAAYKTEVSYAKQFSENAASKATAADNARNRRQASVTGLQTATTSTAVYAYSLDTPAVPYDEASGPFSENAAVANNWEPKDMCRDSSEIDILDRSILDLKARYWAAKIRNSGFVQTNFASSPGAGILNPKIKEQFYDLLEAWRYKKEIPGLSLAELAGLLETEEKILQIIKSCNIITTKT